MKKTAVFIFIALFICQAFVSGAVSLTPALDIISDSEEMTVSLFNTDTNFKSSYFKTALGLSDSDVITVTELPENGRLRYGKNEMRRGDEIAVSSVDSLSYNGETGISDFFVFTVNNSYSVRCALSVSERVNFSPVVSGEAARFTYNNTSLFGTLGAFDPDYDRLCFDIESYPKKGLFSFIDKNEGTYVYTPFEKCSGEDSFSYRVHDSAGNYSPVCTVNISIERNGTYVFSDISESENSVCIVSMVKSGIMDASEGDGRILKFSPDDSVTRQDFVVSAMKLYGADNVPEVDKTSFADDDKISAGNKSFVQAALRLGFIEGREENGELFFDPCAEISAEEACVIIGRINGTDEVHYAMANADGLISPFSNPAVMALYRKGVFSSYGLRDIELSAPLTRGKCAELLYSIKNS